MIKPVTYAAGLLLFALLSGAAVLSAAPGAETPPEPKQEKIALPGSQGGVNPETFRMIETIEKKNRELKRREEELNQKEQQLKVLESKIKSDLGKIEAALARSEEQLGIQNERIRENINALIKAYSSMKPDEAATLLEALDEQLAIKILAGMRSKAAGKILSRLDVKTAKNISEKMAGQKRTAPPKKPSK